METPSTAVALLVAEAAPPEAAIQTPQAFTLEVACRMADELAARLTAATLIAHPGENGRARENLIREFFASLLPKGFSLDSGFVIDANGRISLQQDIVIYRDSYHPVFSVGGIRHFPIEAVAAVIEAKAAISSKQVLRGALDNGASVKALDRTGGSRNYVVSGNQQAEQIDSERHDHQVFTAIVASDCMAVDVVKEELNSWLPTHPRRHWFNSITVIGKFSTAYMPHAPRVDPMAATELGFALGQEEDQRNTRPILDLTQQLMSFLRVCPIIDYQPSAYLPGSYHPASRIALPPPTD